MRGKEGIMLSATSLQNVAHQIFSWERNSYQIGETRKFGFYTFAVQKKNFDLAAPSREEAAANSREWST